MIISRFGTAIIHLCRSRSIALGIAHRDLDASNIMVAKNGKHYITDFESMTITFAVYDLIRLTLTPDIDAVPNQYQAVLKKPENVFLRIYILFHLILSANALPTVKQEYFEKMKTL